MPRVAEGPVIALIDGEHHPSACATPSTVSSRARTGGRGRSAEARRSSGPAHSRTTTAGPLRRIPRTAPAAARAGAVAVVDLADEPVLPAWRKLALAALALHLGLRTRLPA